MATFVGHVNGAPELIAAEKKWRKAATSRRNGQPRSTKLKSRPEGPQFERKLIERVGKRALYQVVRPRTGMFVCYHLVEPTGTTILLPEKCSRQQAVARLYEVMVQAA